MHIKHLSSVGCLASLSACLIAVGWLSTCAQESAPATPVVPAPLASPATPAAANAASPTAKGAPSVVAGIPVNYDEAKVGTYTLPNPLKLNDGRPVRDAKTWREKRRPEIVKLFETQQFGVAPGRPADESFEVFDKGTPALNGKAIRKQVRIYRAQLCSLLRDGRNAALHLARTREYSEATTDPRRRI